eukprot:NODE_18199_length_905_cov_4.059126.p1 GENE.NODE_18199_length_905_cov_4.059126~~NODE_18199_length_905_cov_4.059126.p1  ORF type:complete len:191 (+),score=33.50 NODE_18199_length_905_cov_4.059126:100-672(+)
MELRGCRWALASLTFVGMLPAALTSSRMPDAFDFEKDWDTREKWKRVAQTDSAKCSFCFHIVEHVFETVGGTLDEDKIYDVIDGICEQNALFDGFEFEEVEGTGTYKTVKAKRDGQRTAHAVTWQTYAMQVLCDDAIKPHDDDIKDIALRFQNRKRKDKKHNEEELKVLMIGDGCRRMNACRKKEEKQDL